MKRRRENVLLGLHTPSFPSLLVSTFRGILDKKIILSENKSFLPTVILDRSRGEWMALIAALGKKSSLTLDILDMNAVCSVPRFCFCELKRAGAAYARNPVSYQVGKGRSANKRRGKKFRYEPETAW